MTAYMLWCQEYRRKIVRDNPDLDFVSISKKLGEAWKMLPEKEKIAWRRKAKVPASKGSMLISTGRPSNTAVSTPATTSAPSTTPAAAPHGRASGGATKVAAAAVAVTPATTLVSAQEDARAMASTGEGPRSLGIGPVDVAAHLKLLGESLSTIGQRLTEHEGQIAVSGSLSVLLDSTLCALGPLLCLTAVGKEMNGCSKETLTRILNNIAYVMPGL
uniref:Sox4 n=1 Tax=Rhipicephalus zambeziensis TaxID=60191 RepID=A0A224Z9A7_9ACAR